MANYSIFLVLTFSSLVSARIDLFIGKGEMRRLMGVEGELWYVENGVVNRAAVDFEMEILSNVDELFLSWANRDSLPITYAISVIYDPMQSAPSPSDSILSIPSVGAIESSGRLSSDDETNSDFKPVVFSIQLPRCPIRNSIDLRVRIRLEFDWPSTTNRTTLELRRRKRCPAFSETKTNFLLDPDDTGGSGDMDEKLKAKRTEISTASNFLGSATNLFYVSMGCLFGFMVITASLIILYFAKAEDGSCCAGEKTTKNDRDGDDVGSLLLSPPPRSQIVASTPLDRQSVSVMQRQCGGTSGGSVSSSSGLAANGKQSRRSASPSVLSKCTSAAGATSFVSAANGNAVMVKQPPQQQQPMASEQQVPRVFYYNENRQLDLDIIIKRLLVEKSAIDLGQVLLEGTFGEVRAGRIKTQAVQKGQNEEKEDDDEEWTGVVIKSVKEKSSVQQINRFLSETLRFMDLPPQPNISLPLAVGGTDGDDADDIKSASPTRYVVCFKHDGFGNLKKFLLRCRGADSTPSNSGPPPMILSTQDLVYAALQIIRGLLHLHKFRLLHRDVAVRNCLVGHDLTIQICDTGLSRDLFPQDYHCLGDNDNRPIKWLSFESLERSEFSTASDVWAFGVALWELTTLAQQPYSEVDPFEMQTFLSADQRLSQPYNCPDELYLLMYCCWNLHPEARPTFNQLLAALEHFYAQLTQYI